MSLKQKITYKQFKQAKVAWSGLGGDVIDVKKEKVKTKPKVIDNSWAEDYWRLRDREIFKTTSDKHTKQEILERYSFTPQQIFDLIN